MVNDLDKISISTQHIVVRQQNHRLESSLCHEKAIERILVNRRKPRDFRCVACDDRQMIEARWLHACEDFVGIGFEFAQSGFDTDFPD